MLVTSFVSLNIAKLFSFILNIILIILMKSTKLISQIPYSNITVITPHLISIVTIYIIIFLGYYIAKSPELRKRLKVNKKLIIKTIAIVLSITIISVATLNVLEEKKLKLYFVDVGQGDCTYLKTPSGKNILIDGGGNSDKEKYDVGKKVLLPYLLDRRVKKLDYIIVSHFDADHAQGLEAVIQNIKVKNIKYFDSQPWPYPNSLMIGFTAEYESGEIKVDGEEIIHAGWYNKDELPMLPEKTTIARRIIDSILYK